MAHRCRRLNQPLLWRKNLATYRNATIDDVPEIVRFQIAMAKETEGLELDAETCEAGVKAVLGHPAVGEYFVCEIDGIVAASLLITYEWSDWRNGLVWWIQSVYVLRQFRRKGVYRGLYVHIRGLAESQHEVKGIRLYVDRKNTLAQQVYTALGMNGDHYQVFEWMKDLNEAQ
jgi:GNAT superfamily N-acetyltransferase